MQWSLLQTIAKEGRFSDDLQVPAELFRRVVIAALRHKAVFDEEYYVTKNQDINEAIAGGTVASAAEHYYQSGYFEGRQPKHLIVDENFYLENNPDVVKAIQDGKLESAQQHFDYRGFKEGRSPYKEFSLF